MMSANSLCVGKNTHFLPFVKAFFILLSSSIFLLFGYSCTAPKSKTAFPHHVRFNSNIDSLAFSIHNTDSLYELVDEYVQQGNQYGEMMARRVLGERFQERSDYMNAIEHHNLSLVLAEKLKDTLEIVETLNLLGNSFRFLGITGQSAEHFFRALSVCDEWSEQTSDMALKCMIKSHVGIGKVQLTLGNLERAEAAFNTALRGQHKLKNLVGQAELYANLGKIKEHKKQLDSAFLFYERSLEMNRNAKSKVGIAMCYNHFGRLAESNEDLDAALRYYYRAYYLMKGERVSENNLESCLSMARVYMMRGDMENARGYIDEGWGLAEKVRSWKMMSQACLLQSRFDEAMGNHKQALHWYKMSDNYQDSVKNEKTQTFVQKVRQQYVSDRYNKELETLRTNYSEVKRTNRAFLAWTVLAGLFAVLCIAFLLYTLRVRVRSQRMMQHMEKVRTDFFTNITHEFRTPLTVMLGLGQKLESSDDGTDKDTFRSIGSMIVRQGNSLLDLVNQLLDIAKAESAIGNAEWRSGDVAPYLSMIVENCQVYADQKNVTLAYAATERELQMDFVPDYLRKVLQNLLTNAVKYSGEGGKVTVQMSQNGKSMKLVVTDTGRGIAEKDIPHIFDAFYTASNWGIEVSTGVGLAMVRQMVLAMKGKIEVESVLGRGTTFIITLPLRQDVSRFEPMDGTDRPSMEYIPSGHTDNVDLPQDSTTDLFKPLVLVVEDNRDVAAYIGMQLADSYRVAYAMNGKEGLGKAVDILPDLIVTDLMMPVMDGYELCREIRCTDTLKHTPVIIVSAKSTELDKLKGLEAGADAYLYKPFSADEFLLLVSKLIAQGKQLSQKVVTDPVKSETVQMKPHEREFLNKFVDVVYSQMPKGIVDAESLASIMCMSSSQLRRKVLALTGQKLTAYVLQIRLKHAQQLLEGKQDMPVADVASRCGFEDAAYFSRIFKNVYQMTPSQYRRQSPVN